MPLPAVCKLTSAHNPVALQVAWILPALVVVSFTGVGVHVCELGMLVHCASLFLADDGILPGTVSGQSAGEGARCAAPVSMVSVCCVMQIFPVVVVIAAVHIDDVTEWCYLSLYLTRDSWWMWFFGSQLSANRLTNYSTWQWFCTCIIIQPGLLSLQEGESMPIQ